MGRPPIEITEEQRELVINLARIGIKQDRIAEMVGVSANTLRKHCQHELDHGSDEATAKVAATLFDLATGGNVAACIFWMKTRAGWREKMEVTGKDGSPLIPASEPERAELGKRIAFTLAQAAPKEEGESEMKH